jgi:glycosyltransferase involved in cell wall biosynthesis
LGDVIAASRGVVNPSIWPTTTEYVLLETLGLKKPIFTFNVGIHPEIIQNGVNGFIAETPFEMASQMNQFNHDDALYEKISGNAYKLYQSLTNWEDWKKTLSLILNNINAQIV